MLVCAFSGVIFFFFSVGSFSKLPHNISIFFFLLKIRFPLFVIPFFPEEHLSSFTTNILCFKIFLFLLPLIPSPVLLFPFLFSRHLQYHPSKPHLPFLVEWGKTIMMANFPLHGKLGVCLPFGSSLYAHQTKWWAYTVVLPFLLLLPFSWFSLLNSIIKCTGTKILCW